MGNAHLTVISSPPSGTYPHFSVSMRAGLLRPYCGCWMGFAPSPAPLPPVRKKQTNKTWFVHNPYLACLSVYRDNGIFFQGRFELEAQGRREISSSHTISRRNHEELPKAYFDGGGESTSWKRETHVWSSSNLEISSGPCAHTQNSVRRSVPSLSSSTSSSIYLKASQS